MVLKFVFGCFIIMLFILPLSIWGQSPDSADVIISEFLAVNSSNLADEDGEYSDWIELYVQGSFGISLAGWQLTDDPENLFKWQFPDVTLKSGEYLVLFASGKDRRNPKEELHTNFKLSGDGEYLALVRNDGTIEHEFTKGYKKQKSDYSFGLSKDGSSFSIKYFREPSPGEPNGNGVAEFVKDTKFSIDRGFFEKPFSLEITTDTEDAVIRYTTDGTIPDEDHGFVYKSPVMVANTKIIRAQAFREGYEHSNTDTQTYIFLDDILKQPAVPKGYPSTWAGHPADYEMDPEITTDRDSPSYDPRVKDALLAIPTMSLVMDPEDLMGRKGLYQNPHDRASDDRWERPASIEYIIPDGLDAPDKSGKGFQLNCGVKMQGESSARDYEGKHSFRLTFKEDYGTAQLEYRLFPDSAEDQFNTISLRCFSTDSWHFKDGKKRYRRWDSQYIRDVWMRDTMSAMGHLSTHSTYVHLYVNGLYWGLYNPSERPDDAFFYSYDKLEDSPQSSSREDWDIVKDFDAGLFRGSRESWEMLMRSCENGLESREAYQRIQGNNTDGTRNPDYPVLLDIDNLIDYMILHLWACAEDWPHHNWYASRADTDNSAGWRFFVWDQEIVLDSAFRDRINADNFDSPAYVYNALRANAEFRTRFGDRVHLHMLNGGPLSIEGAQKIYKARAEEINLAIIAESARWGDFRQDVPDPQGSEAELYTKEKHWLPELDKVLNQYIPLSHELALERFRKAGLYPDPD